MTTPLFIFGMFRSGTTLVSRMLNAIPGVMTTADPSLEFFKSYRDAVCIQHDIPYVPHEMIRDYYWDQRGLKIYRAVQLGDMRLVMRDKALPELAKRVHEPTCRGLGPGFDSSSKDLVGRLLDTATDQTYAAFAERWMRALSAHYEADKYCGFKEVWATEFLPALSRVFPTARFILVVRDPRAVAASKNVWPEKFPWLLLMRQWRKLAALSWYYADLSPNVLLLRYEDVVRAPANIAVTISNWLELTPNPAELMVNPENWTDDAGNPWQQNTSHGNPAKAFDEMVIDRWKDVLPAPARRYIETFCDPEMGLLGYSHNTDVGEVLATATLNPPIVPLKDIAPSVLSYRADQVATAAGAAMDSIRFALLSCAPQHLAAVTPALVEAAFIVPTVFVAARTLIAAKQKEADR